MVSVLLSLPRLNEITIPAHGTVHNKDYSSIFSNIDSDSDSVDGSSVVRQTLSDNIIIKKEEPSAVISQECCVQSEVAK